MTGLPEVSIAISNEGQPIRQSLFRLYAGRDAQDILAWLDRNRAWQVMRVSPPYSPELGVRAVLLASNWYGGGSAMLGLARTRMIADDAHRERLRREVRLLVEMMLENPVGSNSPPPPRWTASSGRRAEFRNQVAGFGD